MEIVKNGVYAMEYTKQPKEGFVFVVVGISADYVTYESLFQTTDKTTQKMPIKDFKENAFKVGSVKYGCLSL